MKLKERRREPKVVHLKERLMICNEEDTDGRARVTRDEERVLHVD